MSYDLMVFDQNKAPKTKAKFMKWYQKQIEWSEDHNYQSIDITSTNLRNWFLEMIKTFPSMNGTFAPDDIMLEQKENAELYLSDYSIGYHIIYVAFSWSLVEEAYNLVRKLAKKYDIGFFDVSSSRGDIILSDGTIL